LGTEVLAIGVSTTREGVFAASCCLAIRETALRNGREVIVIPGTSENGRKHTGREDARTSNNGLRRQKLNIK